MLNLIKSSVWILLVFVLSGCSSDLDNIINKRQNNIKSFETTEVTAEESSGEGQSEIELIDYIAIDFTGTDGEGVADFTIDRAALASRLFNLTVESVEDLPPQRLLDFEDFETALEVDFNKSEHLKNGDRVRVKVTIPERELKKVSKFIKINSEKKIVKVEGLLELNPDELSDSQLMAGYITFQEWKGTSKRELAEYVQERKSEYIERCREIGKVPNDNFINDNPVIITRDEEKQLYADAGWLDYTRMPANVVQNGIMVQE